MTIRVAELLMSRLGELRFEPVDKRVRALIGDRAVFDTTRAVLVWEPFRIVPQYAVPEADVDAVLLPAHPEQGDRNGPGLQLIGPAREVLTPDTGFGVHSCDGDPLSVRLEGAERAAAAFRPADTSLAGYVFVDFAAFDTWLEEDEPIVGHPRDPFHRIDIRRSSRSVRIELDGHVLAESSHPHLLFETNLPTRYYLPAEDVDTSVLTPSDTTSTCAYKGVASYWSATLPDRTAPDIAWSYRSPLADALQVTGLVSFFTERTDAIVDGVALERPVTPWS